MRVLVTGATGFLGRYVVRRLLADGDTVWALGRNWADSADLVQAGALPIQADLRDRAAVIAACARADAVIHAGALSAPWGRWADFQAINVGGTRNVLAGCQTHAVSRLVYVSSPSVVFSGHDHRNMTEDAPYPAVPASLYSASKRDAEIIIRASSVPAVIVRPKALFGPGDTALLPRVVRAAQAGRLPQIGDGCNEVDLTYVDNVAHALALALRAPAAIGNTYHITNDAHPRLWDVVRQVLRDLGVTSRLRRRPLAMMLLAARALETVAMLSGREPLLTTYTVRILARTQTYDISAAKRDLGYAPIVLLDDAIARTVANFQEGR